MKFTSKIAADTYVNNQPTWYRKMIKVVHPANSQVWIVTRK